jgi:hypothetical protein
MAVRAQELEILESVIVPISIAMVELKGNGTAIPRKPEANLASTVFDALMNQSSLQAIRGTGPTRDKNLKKRLSRHNRGGDSATPAFLPKV